MWPRKPALTYIHAARRLEDPSYSQLHHCIISGSVGPINQLLTPKRKTFHGPVECGGQGLQSRSAPLFGGFDAVCCDPASEELLSRDISRPLRAPEFEEAEQRGRSERDVWRIVVPCSHLDKAEHFVGLCVWAPQPPGLAASAWRRHNGGARGRQLTWTSAQARGAQGDRLLTASANTFLNPFSPPTRPGPGNLRYHRRCCTRSNIPLKSLSSINPTYYHVVTADTSPATRPDTGFTLTESLCRSEVGAGWPGDSVWDQRRGLSPSVTAND
ncbi:hypothetical protein MHYP_G00074220 [Metynnis hypsauchen]